MKKAASSQKFSRASSPAPCYPFPTVIRNGNKNQLLSKATISANLLQYFLQLRIWNRYRRPFLLQHALVYPLPLIRPHALQNYGFCVLYHLQMFQKQLWLTTFQFKFLTWQLETWHPQSFFLGQQSLHAPAEGQRSNIPKGKILHDFTLDLHTELSIWRFT